MVDQYCQGDPNLVALEDNIAVFVRTEWRGRTQLSYANIQSVIATCDLDGYYLGENATAIYLRLDFDYKTLGDPFSHPLAHIHADGDLSPGLHSMEALAATLLSTISNFCTGIMYR